ncbi:S-layer homology domain-containing protein [Acutalibacter muris]|uniref:S-layer homology domain-containing protein n=1 Tax=Acutalibacter muris TaxID=1796620 RepID=UPI00272C0A48|nr:S-layer homology domain-containing protein [Acutalibacter muris]
MRKTILIVLMVLVLVIPAYAAEGEAATDQPIQQEQEQDKEPVIVSSLEELQAAVNAAEDGDTIYVAAAIGVSGETIEADKTLTLANGNDQNGELLRLYDGAIVKGLSFSATDFSGGSLIKVEDATTVGVTIENCHFECLGDESVDFVHIYGNLETNKAYIKQCTFIGATTGAVVMTAHTDVQIYSCNFEKNHRDLPGGAISSAGKLYVTDSTFTDNAGVSAGGILCSNDLTIEDCQFAENTIAQGGSGRDILSTGKTSIVSTFDNSFSFYDESTGKKVDLPLVNYEGAIRLAYLTEEQAAEYFAPEPGDNDNDEDTPPEQSQPPQEGDQTGDDDNDTGGEHPPQDGSGDDPADTPSQPPEQPTEPPQDDTTDNPADTTPNTPQPPQKPSDGGNSGDDDYTPPIDYRPSQRPTWPVVTVKPTEDNKPQDQPENNPAPAKPQLACNGAVIDTSRTVVLLGYGDGLLHENDPLTRAQLATIIYRILDDDSIAKFSNAQVAFTDVAADAWYAPYVRVIQASRIANGVGGGKYDPNGKVTWTQILAILSRFVEQKEYTLQHIQYSGWAQGAIETAVALGWIEDNAGFSPDAVIGRGELVQFINDVLALYR